MPSLNAIGAAVLDRRIVGPLDGPGDKHDCLMHTTLGGGCVNTLRAAARHVDAPLLSRRLLMLKGTDATGQELLHKARAEAFAEVHPLNLLERSRESVLLDNRCYTVRPPVRSEPLSPSVVVMLREADWTIVAPLGEHDADFVESILRHARQTLLQLSMAQLSDAAVSIELARQATWTVLNEAEFKHWTGAVTLAAGHRWLQDRELGGVLVTTADGVAVFTAEQVDFQPSYRLADEQIRQTVGAGDCFTGAMAAMLANGAALHDAIAGGQRAAARHLLNIPANQLEPADESHRPLPEVSPSAENSPCVFAGARR